MFLQCLLITFAIQLTNGVPPKYRINAGVNFRYEHDCDKVCQDLPKEDSEPVCMMYSRYKKGYQFFMNQCHARRTICKENLFLNMVHPTRCMKSNQFYMPVN